MKTNTIFSLRKTTTTTMSLVERDKIILTIIFSIVGFIFIVLIISVLLWRIIKYYHSKTKHMNSINNNNNHSHPISSYKRPQYQRSQKYLSTKFDHHQTKTKKRKKRSNTNDSAITLSFNPPHLINQNVKNLEKLFHNESTLTANSWLYEQTLPKTNCYYTNSSKEPIYASSSTVLTSISNLAIVPSQINNKSFHYLNELDHILRIKHPLKYSQSCRQTTDSLPFDYYRSISPPSTILSNNNSLEPIYIRTNKQANATLIRKTRLAQLRDDTAILY